MTQTHASPPRGGAARRRAERLEARVTTEQKALIERAAALQGRTITDFVLTSVQEAARRAIEDHELIRLSLRDAEAFVAALVNSREPSVRLREKAARHRSALGNA